MSPAAIHEAPQQLVLSRHAALKSRRDGDVLVLPERAIRVGGSGGEILALCEQPRSADAVVEAIRARYPEAPEIETQVRAFLDEMLAAGGIVRVEPAAGPAEGSAGRSADGSAS